MTSTISERPQNKTERRMKEKHKPKPKVEPCGQEAFSLRTYTLHTTDMQAAD